MLPSALTANRSAPLDIDNIALIQICLFAWRIIMKYDDGWWLCYKDDYADDDDYNDADNNK